jgi:hypothetical protein
MKKMAVFVEGQTEQIFVEKLINEIGGRHNVLIENIKAKFGKKKQRQFIKVSAKSMTTGQKYYVLICDCGTDSRIKDDILESYDSMSKSGYERILGLRDVYPHRSGDIPKLINGLNYGLPTAPIPITIILAKMEIEAWFLGEVSHLRKIHTALSPTYINSNLGLDLLSENLENRQHPSDDLNKIYKLVSLAYNKKKRNCERTVNALDYAEIYINLPQRLSQLRNFLAQIDSFMV